MENRAVVRRPETAHGEEENRRSGLAKLTDAVPSSYIFYTY